MMPEKATQEATVEPTRGYTDPRQLYVVKISGLDHAHLLLEPQDAAAWYGANAVPASQ